MVRYFVCLFAFLFSFWNQSAFAAENLPNKEDSILTQFEDSIVSDFLKKNNIESPEELLAAFISLSLSTFEILNVDACTDRSPDLLGFLSFFEKFKDHLYDFIIADIDQQLIRRRLYFSIFSDVKFDFQKKKLPHEHPIEFLNQVYKKALEFVRTLKLNNPFESISSFARFKNELLPLLHPQEQNILSWFEFFSERIHPPGSDEIQMPSVVPISIQNTNETISRVYNQL